MTRSVFLTLGLLIPVSIAAGQPGAGRLPEGATVHRDLEYVTDGHERQKLDLYLPKDGKDLPLIINIHGGAWRAGSKEDGRASGVSGSAATPWRRSTTG